MSETSTDYEQPISFLKNFHGQRPRHITAICEGKAPVTKTFESSEDEKMIGWVENQNQYGANIYFAVNVLSPNFRNRKAKKRDVAQVAAFHVDVDDPSEEALERLVNFDPKPTVILFSGGGYQAFWLLNEPSNHLRSAETINKSLAKALGGDNCHNIDRIMRVPGTDNYPNAKKRAVGRVETAAYVLIDHTDFTRTYTLDDFAEFTQTTDLTAYKPSLVIPAYIPVKTLADFGIAEDSKLGNLIKTGDDPQRPRTSNRPHYKSRSEAVFAVCCEPARRGHTAEKIAGLLINPDYKISDSILEKSNPTEYAFRQATKAIGTVVRNWPETFKNGNPIRSLRNTLYVLKLLEATFENDIFHNRKRMGGHLLQSYQGDLTDDGCAALRKLIIDKFGFDPGKQHLLDAVQILCIENSHHPIRDYLSSLIWDNTQRIETWLIDYMGVADTPLNRAIGKLMLVAAVRRVMKPGCKFDTMVVLEGPQGSGKSTALVILASDGNFSDQNLFALDNKSQMEALEGVWVYEVSELDGMNRAETSQIKAFITRTEDRGRPAYARFKESWPRQCILVGTTNETWYLKDTTGNRRFLPVRTTNIDLKALRKDRDQLWAEARKLEASGYSIILPENLWKDAADTQKERMQEDPWLDVLATVRGRFKGGMERISTRTLFGQEYLNIAPAQQQSYHPKRIGQNMRALGWTGPKRMRIEGCVVRGYERETDQPDSQEL